jgi:glycosyltransferase involved in cell wall biosynthesis
MKIAVIHNQLTGGGGMESYLQALLRGFIEAGDEPHVYTYEVDRDVAARLSVTVHRTNLFFLPRRLRKYWFLHLCNRTFLRSNYDLSLSLTRTACQDLAVIGGVHTASMLSRGTKNWYRALHDRFEMAFEAKMLRSTPCIMAHSALIRDEMLKHYAVAETKIRVIYPPVDTKRFQIVSLQEQEEVRRNYRLDPRMTLLFPSLDHERKGLSSLLQSFAHLDPDRYCLLIAGQKPKRSLELPVNVRYVGYVENLSGLYSVVDYVVLPSSYEPFGLVVAESLQCGTPVLVTRQVGASELLHPEDGCILPDNRPEGLTSAITGLEKKRVAPGFARRNGLELEQHIHDLKRFVHERKKENNVA